MKFDIQLRKGEVLEFVTTQESYTIHVKPNLRLDVARCSQFRVDADSPTSFWSYLWLQSVQGFFVLRQATLEGRTLGWEMVYEVVPAEFSSSFFPWLSDHFEALISEWNQTFGEGSTEALAKSLEDGD